MTDVRNVKRNLRLYAWGKIFSIRVYLPLTNVYLVEVGHLTIAQIGILGAAAAITTLVANVPSGYIADRFTRKSTMLTATGFMAVSTALFAIAPTFPVALLATILSFIGYAFYSGAGEALVHDTLAESGEEDDYIKVMGRAQSFGLVGNVVLVGLVPLTYVIDKRLPFVFGTFAALIFMAVTARTVEPRRPAFEAEHHNPAIDLYLGLRRLVGRHTFMIFMATGLVSAIYLAQGSFNNLVFFDLGFNPELLGLMFAASSAIAALGGWLLHYLRRLTLPMYAAIDVVIATGAVIAMGVSQNLVVAIIAFLINMSFWRFRKIMYQDYMLKRFSGHNNKAMLISTLGFFESVNAAWMPFAFVATIAAGGYYQGYTIVGVALAVLFGLAFWAGFAALGKRKLLPA